MEIPRLDLDLDRDGVTLIPVSMVSTRLLYDASAYLWGRFDRTPATWTTMMYMVADLCGWLEVQVAEGRLRRGDGGWTYPHEDVDSNDLHVR